MSRTFVGSLGSRWIVMFSLLGIAMFSLAASTALAQPRSDGEILESKPRASLPPYATLDDFSRNYFPQTVYDEPRLRPSSRFSISNTRVEG